MGDGEHGRIAEGFSDRSRQDLLRLVVDRRGCLVEDNDRSFV